MATIPNSIGGVPVRATGIPWYFRQDYRRILEIMTDAHLLPPSYDAWRQKAERLERRPQSEGMIVVRAEIDPDEFPRWCAARGLNVDAKARGEFASEAAYRRVSQAH